ncbi:hypothetical protein N8193_01175 [Gammaproteobacteria bacterium]|jgi:hypothetical protein|nr:hypothetical protein [Gammaproteobacteria bacterium]|tara:strand:+ start:215 stop:982 length:768 start_codon:yes stop_codon:yes gene_type:complete
MDQRQLKKYRDLINHHKNGFKELKCYVYALCELKDGKKIPFYIGKGTSTRCLSHLFEKNENNKTDKIKKLLQEDRLVIDILRHGLDSKVYSVVEATCIDLLDVEDLENLVKGSGSKYLGRLSLEESLNLYSKEETKVQPQHSGLAFILNKTYRSSMQPMELLEATRGTWSRPPRDDSVKYAFATYHKIVKEVYKIEAWLPAGTQQYFFRDRKFGDERLKSRWEFIGRIADDEVRNIYLGRKLEMDRSYGTPFIRV